MGFRPFFYFLDRNRILFSGDIRQILSSARVSRQLNVEKLSTLTVAGALKLLPDESFHAGIMVLNPGSWMIVSESGVRKHTYWRPEIREHLVPGNEDELYLTLGHLLKEAVEARVSQSHRAVALLSGGLDSSSVVSLAARALSQRGQTLTALAAVVSDELRSQTADEREFIDQFRGTKGIDIRYITAHDRGPFDCIEDPRFFETGFLRSSRTYLYDAFESAAIASGSDIMLEGDGGEYGATNWGAPYYAELAFRGQWLSLLRLMQSVRCTEGGSPVRDLAGQCLSLAGSRRHFRPLVLLREDFMKSVRQRPLRATRSVRWPNQRKQQTVELRGWLARSSLRLSVPEKPELRRSFPLFDKRVMEFCLAVPGKYKVRNGYRRYLIRRALDGILPPRIQWRTTKAPFSPDYFIRYNKQLGKVREFVRSIERRDPVRTIVDVDTLTTLVERPPVANGDRSALTLVPTTVYLICFLRQFSEFNP
jgi:asparagine synthase (glutamine-hydrolysing)